MKEVGASGRYRNRRCGSASLGLGRLLESQLLGVSGRDPWVIGCATLALATVALLAGFLPAMRATRVDPLSALRHE